MGLFSLVLLIIYACCGMAVLGIWYDILTTSIRRWFGPEFVIPAQLDAEAIGAMLISPAFLSTALPLLQMTALLLLFRGGRAPAPSGVLMAALLPARMLIVLSTVIRMFCRLIFVASDHTWLPGFAVDLVILAITHALITALPVDAAIANAARLTRQHLTWGRMRGRRL